jgi:hypothetical protein
MRDFLRGRALNQSFRIADPTPLVVGGTKRYGILAS